MSRNNTIEQLRSIISAVAAKVVQTLGGKKSNAYKDTELMSRVFHEIYRSVNRTMGVRSYKMIAPSDVGKYITYVKYFEPSPELFGEILELNL